MLVKVFETALVPRLRPQTQSLISLQQHGFMDGRSVQTNLLELTHYVHQVLDQSLSPQIDIIYTDFEKAVDKISHNKLLSKMNALGFSDAFLQLLGLYLWQREQMLYFEVLNYKYSTAPPACHRALYT